MMRLLPIFAVVLLCAAWKVDPESGSGLTARYNYDYTGAPGPGGPPATPTPTPDATPVPIYFTITIAESTEVTDPATSTAGATQDRVMTILTGADTAPTYTLTPVLSPQYGGIAEVTYESLHPAIAEVDAAGIVTIADAKVSSTVEPATIRITLTNEFGVTVIQDTVLSFWRSSGQDTTTFPASGAGVAGSLRKHIVDVMDAAATVGGDKTLYTSQNHGANTYVRNTGTWLKGVGVNTNSLTCISPWNSVGANTRAGTLITPRHVVVAAHYGIGTGATIRFVDTDNTVVTRTVQRSQTYPGYKPYYPDFQILLLNEDMPEGWGIAKVLPSNWQSYLPTGTDRIPTIGLDKEEKALIQDGGAVGPAVSGGTFYNQTPTFSSRSVFYESKISGDSGNPCFLLINGELVLMTVWTSGGPGSGTSVTGFVNGLNAAITSIDAAAGVSTGYQLTPVDLSSFTQF